jgi:signal transduction histidine kinase
VKGAREPTMSKRRSVAARVLASYILVLMAFAATAIWSIVSERRAGDEAELLRTGYVPLKSTLERAFEEQNRVSAQLNHVGDAQARSWIETARRVRPKTFAEIRSVAHGLARLRDPRATSLEAELVREASELEQYLQGDGDRLTRLFDSVSRLDAETTQKLQNDAVLYEVEGVRRLKEQKDRIERGMDDLVLDMRVRERRSIVVLIALSCLTLVVGIMVTLYSRRVLRPLEAVTARAKAVAQGDLTPHEVVASTDEIGELAATFEGMVAAIARANQSLVQAERLAAIGKMAAHVTHEIRNPLSSMGLNIEMLEEELAQGGDAAESRQLVRAIKKEIDRLAELSEQYLRLARRPELHAEPGNMTVLVRQVVSFVEPELRSANVTCSLDVGEPMPDIAFDEGQIRQALFNLIRNAREAMQPAGGSLRVSIQKGQGGVDLLIDDEGSGIKAEARDKIFDPFFTTKQRGTGLGLAVTRQIIEAHGGTIACEPREPKGTRFSIHLPA